MITIEGTNSLPNPGFNSKPVNGAGSGAFVANFESSYRNIVPNPYVVDKWSYVNALGGWNDVEPASQETGLHFEFTFINALEVYAEVTDIVTDTVMASGTGWIFDDSSVIGDIGGWFMFADNTDNDVTIENFTVTHRGAHTPTPAHGATNVPLDQVLSWTAPNDPNIVTVDYDVYVDPNQAKVISRIGCEYSNTGQAGTTFDPTSDLEYNTTYYWRVDVNGTYDDPGESDPNSSVWSFTTASSVPVIAEFDNVSTARSLLPAGLAAVVTDSDNNLTDISFEWLSDDVWVPAGAVGTLTDTTTNLYAPTATFGDDIGPDPSGWYLVRLTVTDGGGNSVSRDAVVQVFETTCDLAKDPLYGLGLPTDLYDSDQDCDVDIIDFAVFAAKWLDDISATEQLPVDAAWANYVPIVNGIANGNFETGDFLGWRGPPYQATITDVGADVYEGSYAATFDSYGGITVDPAYLDLPLGNHTITLQYKGNLTTLECEFYNAVQTAEATITSPADPSLLVLGAVGTYTQYSVQFTVTTAGTGAFYVRGNGGGIGTGFVDDFRLILNSH